MKKTLRLTESQLQTIIERSLTEAKNTKAKLLKKQPNKLKAKPFTGKLKEEVEMEDVFLSEEQVNEIWGFSAKEQFEKHYNEFTSTWEAKGVPAANKEEIMSQAAADKYEGKLKLQGSPKDVKNAKFIYVPASGIKWQSDFGSGGTGGKTGAGGV